MAHLIDRRSWLKSSALLAGSLTFFNGLPTTSLADTSRLHRFSHRLTDATLSRKAPPELKARLFANENPFGPSQKAKQAILDALDNSYQYPHFFVWALQEKIAEKEKLTPKHVLMGAGSSTLLQAAAMHYSKKGGTIITGDPSYDDLPEIAHFFNSPIERVPLTSDYTLDLEAMEKKINNKTSLVYICNPNNPTGTALDAAELKEFCSRVSQRVPVFVDEAYIDYLPDPDQASLMSSVRKGENVLVARTFSKLHGFAGLRVGYVVAPPALIQQIEPYTTGMNCLSMLSTKAALASYEDTASLAESLDKTMASREYLNAQLLQEGYKPIPSTTNFVLFPIHMDSERFADEMWKRGVGIRPWKFNKQNWCRVSIGKMEEMQAFVAAFKELS